MECRIFIDRECEERVEIYAQNPTKRLEDIKEFVESLENTVVGYIDEEMVELPTSQIYCFTVEDSKVYAYTKDKKYRLKQRLYQIEMLLGGDFLRFNQSCIGSVRQVERFEAPLSGALNVVFKNGHKDFVSRRNMKSVKERFLK